jgi:hypothetical protein
MKAPWFTASPSLREIRSAKLSRRGGCGRGLRGGNVNGFFRSGRVVDAGGKSLNDFHTSLGNAFGLSDTTFGNPAYCDGPLALLR